MNFKYLEFPLYIDKTDNIQNILESSDAIFSVFVHKTDWNDQNKDLLYKILQAIKLEIPKDVQIFGLREQDSIHLASMISEEHPHRFLAFGLNADRIGLQIKTLPYKIIEVKNLKILFAHKLTDLQSNVNYKKQLWSLLQKFN